MLRPIEMKTPVELVYQSIEGLHKAIPNIKEIGILSGNYPTPGGMLLVNKAFINFYEQNYRK